MFSDSEFGEFIDKTLDQWHVPGLAIGIVKDGQLILCEGYGLRNVSKTLPVTPDTLFPIASCTKAFTAMSAGLLIDEGKLDLDRPVKEYLPAFKLWDAFATERMTPRDLLTHRSGLPGHDMLWYASNFSRREIFNRLRYLEPSRDLRCAFQYQNLMYLVAGILVSEIASMGWEQFVQTRILDRLGMLRSNFSTDVTQQSVDFATPYLYSRGGLREIPFFRQDGENCGTGPAGDLCSCVGDMVKWVNLHLNRGKIGGQALISEATLAQMHTPQIFVNNPLVKDCYGDEFGGYGLGWGVRLHKGQLLVEHDGMGDGFYSLVSMMPRQRVGVVALSNCDAYHNPVQSNMVPNIVVYTLYDRLLGLEPTDWNALMRAVYDERSGAVKHSMEQAAFERKANAPPSHPIESYLGNYEHPAYGVLSIRRVGEQLQAVMNDKLVLPMEHFHYDVFEVYFEMADQRQKISFMGDVEGHIAQVVCPLDPMVKAAIFTRMTR